MVLATYLSSPLDKQSGNFYEHTDKHDFRHRKGNVESNSYRAHPFKSSSFPAGQIITLQECQKLSRSGMH